MESGERSGHATLRSGGALQALHYLTERNRWPIAGGWIRLRQASSSDRRE